MVAETPRPLISSDKNRCEACRSRGTVDSTPLAGRARLVFLGPHPRADSPPQLQLFMGGSSGTARVRLYDVLGRRLGTPFEANLPAGATRLVPWDGKDGMGRLLPAGVYLARFTAPGIGITRRMVLLSQ